MKSKGHTARKQRRSRPIKDRTELWRKVLEAPETDGRSKQDIDRQLADERGSWNC